MHTRLLVLAVGLMTFMLMLVMETSKELIFGDQLNSWQSHWITIGFTTIAMMTVCLLLLHHMERLQKKRQQLTIREEQLRTLEQVMFKVNHHVNNLANNLQLIELENQGGRISDLTLTELREAVHDTVDEMRRLSAATDPTNPDLFRIVFDSSHVQEFQQLGRYRKRQSITP